MLLAIWFKRPVKCSNVEQDTTTMRSSFRFSPLYITRRPLRNRYGKRYEHRKSALLVEARLPEVEECEGFFNRLSEYWIFREFISHTIGG